MPSALSARHGSSYCGPFGTHIKYDGFMSYSHSDRPIAAAVQLGLHRFAKPIWRIRNLRVYRDDSDLVANPAFWTRITEALDSSRFLIVVLSEHAARSIYVDREIAHWLAGGRQENLLLILAGGGLCWEDSRKAFNPEASTAAPPTLLQPGIFAGEPLYVDVTWSHAEAERDLHHARFRSAIVTLAAPIHGRDKAELDGEDVREHRRLRRLRRFAVSTLAGLTVLASIAAAVAVGQERRAEREAAVARAQAFSVRADNAETPWAALGLAVQAEAETREPLGEARAAFARAVQRVGRVPVRPAVEPMLGHDGPVYDVAWSPDGHRIATAGLDPAVYVWDPQNAEQLLTLREDGVEAMYSVAWSPDGGRLATGGDDGVVRIWDVGDGRVAERIVTRLDQVYSVAWSNDGDLLAAGGDNGTVFLWDARTGASRGEPLPSGELGVFTVAFTSDGAELLSEGDGTIRAWDTTTGEPAGDYTVDGGALLSLATSADGSDLATGGLDGSVLVWDRGVAGPSRLELPASTFPVEGLAWSPDLLLATGDSQGVVRIWDGITGEPYGDAIETDAGEVKALAWSPDGRYLVVGADDGGVRVWEYTTVGVQVGTLGEHTGSVWTAAWSLDGTKLASGADDETVLIRGRRIDDPVVVIEVGDGSVGDEAALAVAWSPDGAVIAIGDYGGAVGLWDPETGEARGDPLEGHGAPVQSVAWSPDGSVLASGGDDGTVRLWDPETGEARGDPLEGHGAPVQSVAWSPDGSVLASGGDDGTVQLWSQGFGQTRGEPLVATSDAEISSVYSVAWSPSGRVLASGSDDGFVRLWDIGSHELLGDPLVAHDGLTMSVAWSPDGARLASAGTDHRVQIWPAMTEREACEIAMTGLGSATGGTSGASDDFAACLDAESVADQPELPLLPEAIYQDS